MVRELTKRGVHVPPVDSGTLPPSGPPDFRPDALTGTDLLGIGNDVEALASLLAARNVALPLSIGLGALAHCDQGTRPY